MAEAMIAAKTASAISIHTLPVSAVSGSREKEWSWFTMVGSNK